MSDPDRDPGRAGESRPARLDRPALDERVLAEYGWVRRLAGRLLRSDSDADDVTQEVVAAALHRRPRVERGSGIRRWLDRVTRRQASRWRARGRRRREVEAQARAAADAGRAAPDPSEVVDRLQMHRALTDAVLELPEPYRSVVVARFLDESSVAEIAQQRRTSEAAVRQQLARAVAMLRTRLAKARGEDWRAGLALLVSGGGRTAPPTAVPDAGPNANPIPVAAPAVAFLTMKSILGVLLAATAAVLLWQVWPTVPDHRIGERADPRPEGLRSETAAAAAPRTGAGQGTGRTEVPVAPASDSFVLRVVDFAGSPLPGVTVVLAPDRADLVPGDFERKVTDGDGRVELDAGRPDGGGARSHRLLLAADSRVPEWAPFEVPEPGTERTFRYGGPGTAGGVVTTVGDPAALGSEVGARPRLLRLPGHGRVGDLPQPVTDEFARSGLLHLIRGTATVDPASGAFAFHGLPESRETVNVGLAYNAPFVVHPELTVAESADRESAVLQVGRTDHVVAVVPIPAIRLRAVFDDGTPAAHAFAHMRPWLVDDDGPAYGFTADAEGIFSFGMSLDSIPLHRYLDPDDQPRVMRVDVHGISHPAAESHPEFTFEMPSGVRWADAGEVVLQRLAGVHVLALDRSGAPVRGAVFEGTRRSLPTGIDGRTTARTKDPEQRAFKVGAPGMLVDRYEAARGSGTEADPLRFELAPENRVELRLVADDLEADDVLLGIYGPEDLFHAADERIKTLPSWLHRAAGIGMFRSGGRRRSAEFAEDLTFVLVSIVPGARITANVLDKSGAVIVEREFVMPPFGETEQLRLRPDVPICRIDGTVLTADDAPAVAHLTIGEDRKRENRIYRARAWTGADGRFRLRLVASGEEVPVRVEGDGHVILHDRLRLVDGAIEPVFRLLPGYSVIAYLVDHEGAILDTEIEVADREREIGAPFGCERLLDTTTRLTRLPAAGVILRASYGARTFEKRIDPAQVGGPVVLRAPEPERIPIRVAPHVAQDTVLTLAIFSTADDRDRIYLQVHCVDGTWQPSELPIYPGEYRVRCGPYASGKDQETTWTITEDDTEPRWLMR